MARDLCGTKNLNHATAKYGNTKTGKSVMHCAQQCTEFISGIVYS